MHDQHANRPAVPADARGIAQVLVDGWQTTYAGILPHAFLSSFTYEGHENHTREFLQSLPESTAVYVAEERGVIVGVAMVREAADGPDASSAELDALYVTVRRQRQAIGMRLLRHAAKWARCRGRGSLHLWVLQENPCRRFYDRLGAELLPRERQDDFAGVAATSVPYVWRDLQRLDEHLEASSRGRLT
jgi:GNAT superfamily N-acetyltransferase